MTATRDLEQLAWEHSIFPLIQIEDLKQRGPMIFVEGEGVGLADIDGNSLYRHDGQSYPSQLARVWQRRDRPCRLRADAHVALCRDGRESEPSRPSSFPPKSRRWRPAGSHASSTSAADRKRSKPRSSSPSSITSPRAANPAPTRSSRAGTPITARPWARWRPPTGSARGTSPNRGFPATPSFPDPAHYRNPFGMADDDYADFCANYLEQQIHA